MWCAAERVWTGQCELPLSGWVLMMEIMVGSCVARLAMGRLAEKHWFSGWGHTSQGEEPNGTTWALTRLIPENEVLWRCYWSAVGKIWNWHNGDSFQESSKNLFSSFLGAPTSQTSFYSSLLMQFKKCWSFSLSLACWTKLVCQLIPVVLWTVICPICSSFATSALQGTDKLCNKVNQWNTAHLLWPGCRNSWMLRCLVFFFRHSLLGNYLDESYVGLM